MTQQPNTDRTTTPPKGNDICQNVMRFYFKVNNSKLDNQEKFSEQIRLVVLRLILTHKIKSDEVSLKLGTIGDDFVKKQVRLCVSFNCANCMGSAPSKKHINY